MDKCNKIVAMVAALLLGVASSGGSDLTGVFALNGASTNNETLIVTTDRFHYQMRGCFSGAEAFGTVLKQGETLLLQGAYAESGKSFKLRIYIVSWDSETFLIPDKDMLEFCSTVAEGWQGTDEAWIYRFYRTKPQPAFRPLLGLPRVPPAYRRHLFKPFSTTTYISGGKLWIDRGSQDGVVEGMVLNDESRLAPIEVKRVEAYSAMCELLWSSTKTANPEMAGKVYRPGLRMMSVQQSPNG